MAKNFVQDGHILDVLAGSNIVSGAVVIIGTIAGIAIADIASGKTGAVRIAGVFSLPKAAGVAITQGAKVYWNAGAGNVTTTASGNTLFGVAAVAAASGDANVSVLLNVCNA